MRVVLAAVVCAIALFFFGFLWWGVLMPIIKPANVLEDEQLTQQMSSSLKTSGLYIYPDYSQAPADTDIPMVFAYYYTTGPNMPLMMGGGLLHMFVTSLLAGVLLIKLNLRDWSTRVFTVFFLGLFVAVWADIGNMIWWRHPLAWTMFHFGYDALSWLVAALVLATLIKPTDASSATQ